MNSCN